MSHHLLHLRSSWLSTHSCRPSTQFVKCLLFSISRLFMILLCSLWRLFLAPAFLSWFSSLAGKFLPSFSSDGLSFLFYFKNFPSFLHEEFSNLSTWKRKLFLSRESEIFRIFHTYNFPEFSDTFITAWEKFHEFTGFHFSFILKELENVFFKCFFVLDISVVDFSFVLFMFLWRHFSPSNWEWKMCQPKHCPIIHYHGIQWDYNLARHFNHDQNKPRTSHDDSCSANFAYIARQTKSFFMFHSMSKHSWVVEAQSTAENWNECEKELHPVAVFIFGKRFEF